MKLGKDICANAVTKGLFKKCSVIWRNNCILKTVRNTIKMRVHHGLAFLKSIRIIIKMYLKKTFLLVYSELGYSNKDI